LLKHLTFVIIVQLLACNLFAQELKIIDGDVFNFDPEIPNYVTGVILQNDSFIWGYYDCTDCADFFLSKVESEKDSSFIHYFASKGLPVLAVYRSFDGNTGQRCVLCSCANGHRINFKTTKKNYHKMLKLLKGTINQGLMNRYW
jgi:hypothetical protein